MEFRPDYTAAESGLDAFIHWDKDFVGRPAALAEQQRGPARKLVTLVVDTPDRHVVGYEAILSNGACLGHVTWGGVAHHAGRLVAMGYVPPEAAVDGTPPRGRDQRHDAARPRPGRSPS
jgi:dimethylglycine dehydrogenase